MTKGDMQIICSQIVAYIANHKDSKAPVYDCYMAHKKQYFYEEYANNAKDLMRNHKVHHIIDPFEITQISDSRWIENGNVIVLE